MDLPLVDIKPLAAQASSRRPGLTALLKMDRHNMSWIRYPSHVSPDVEDVIAAQSIISRCMHVYVALCVPLSLVTGLFNLSVFIRDRTRLKVLDRLLAGLTVTSILVTLLSLNAAGRPDYMSTTNLGCAALSFFSNICYFTAQYLQVAMLVPSFLPVSSGYQLLMRPVASLAAIGGCAVCSSLIVVSMLGTSGALHATTMCQVDPLAAWPEYEIVKFSLGFALALSFQMVLFLLHATQPACRAAPDTTDSDTDSDSERWVVLAIALNMFACRLFFNAVLLHRAQLKLRQDVGSPRDELLMNLAELALSGESCINLVATLLLHTPCRIRAPFCAAGQRMPQAEAGHIVNLAAFSNSCLNPLIYSFLGETFRDKLRLYVEQKTSLPALNRFCHATLKAVIPDSTEPSDVKFSSAV
ncbi:G-protein coupled estrogen receptor [Cricetulus griseus]|uniref:G-protein coupled estrogen receptor n=1 Tax=Cricetulus griseus TaxID=10029 RepID=A0A061I1W5_CRIGR|nr:G-protein coupled estrogen receptor [Cricetulus griseus]